MNHYCVICTYTTPEGIQLKSVTNDVPAASSGDATFTVMDMLAAKGAEFITITDHSKTAFYAGGLDEERIREQWDEIVEVQEKVGIRI